MVGGLEVGRLVLVGGGGREENLEVKDLIVDLVGLGALRGIIGDDVVVDIFVLSLVLSEDRGHDKVLVLVSGRVEPSVALLQV